MDNHSQGSYKSLCGSLSPVLLYSKPKAEQDLDPISPISPPFESASQAQLHGQARWLDGVDPDTGYSGIKHTVDAIAGLYRTRRHERCFTTGSQNTGKLTKLNLHRRNSDNCLFIHSWSYSSGDSMAPRRQRQKTGLLSPNQTLPRSDDGYLQPQQSASEPSLASGNSHKSNTKTQRSDITSSSKDNGVRDPRYRSCCLNENGVYIYGADEPLPARLEGELERIFRRRGSPELEDAKAAEICQQIELLEEKQEDILRHNFEVMGVVPRSPDGAKPSLERVWGSKLLSTSHILLPGLVVPEGVQTTVKSIVSPAPDMTYGYKLKGWKKNERLGQKSVMDGVKIESLSMPYTDLWWPFFVIEFTARATGGNMYNTTNRCAGGGSVCVKAAYTLCQLAERAAQRAAERSANGVGAKRVAAERISAIEKSMEPTLDCVDVMDVEIALSADMTSAPSHAEETHSKDTATKGAEVTANTQAWEPEAEHTFSKFSHSIAYSVAVENELVQLYIHWYDPEQENYILKKIKSYLISRPDELNAFRTHTKNIIDWGLDQRLATIKAQLELIYQSVNAEAKKRKLEDT